MPLMRFPWFCGSLSHTVAYHGREPRVTPWRNHGQPGELSCFSEIRLLATLSCVRANASPLRGASGSVAGRPGGCHPIAAACYSINCNLISVDLMAQVVVPCALWC